MRQLPCQYHGNPAREVPGTARAEAATMAAERLRAAASTTIVTQPCSGTTHSARW